jgi:HAD superfamily hydrolase (TIGR01509 family)
MPGIQEALCILRPQYRLVLATNAAESGAFLVREALRRVGLEELFHAVFTAQELGVRKPDPAFFAAVLREIGCTPPQAVMIGDDYPVDVAGAKGVGMLAIWFNPLASPCPFARPLHDAEVQEMAELPTVLEDLQAVTR